MRPDADEPTSMAEEGAAAAEVNMEDGAARPTASGQCPGMHALVSRRTPKAGYYCDVCGKKFATASVMLHGCRTCDWDCCDACRGISHAQPTYT